jgi:oxygen-independent coproporphyrinogen III oxidase
MNFDFDLISKYNRPGPRYTSYPTALQFREDFSLDEALEPQSFVGGHLEPLSLYVHLPFCESLCWFCACNTVISRDPRRADHYLDYLGREIELTLRSVDRRRKVTQVHLGGGSPSFLSPEQIHRLGSLLHSHFFLDREAECSVELDPRTMTREKVRAFADIGFTRASFGVQDNNPEIQKRINRHQPQELNAQAVVWLREAGFSSVNVDLVYGLPGQTTESFEQTLESLLSLQPERFATFNYAHVPWMKPAQLNLLRDASLPEASLKFALLRLIIERLTQAGYEFIGMDHFALPEDELASAARNGSLQRNFQGYSTRAGSEILAFGVSSISQGPDFYGQNHKSLKAYYAALDEDRRPIERGVRLSPEDLLRRDVIMTLMCRFAVDFENFSKRYGIDFRKHFAEALEALQEMEADGLLVIEEKALRVSDRGRLLIRNVAMAFDAYTVPSEGRHSRTV